MNPLLTVLLLSSLSFAVAAEEESKRVDSDVRLTLSALPRSYDATLTNKDTGKEVSHDSGTLDSAGWLAVDYQASVHGGKPIAFLFGGGLDVLGMSEENASAKDTGGGVGVHGTIGVGFRPTAMLSLEASLLGGFGAASMTIKDKGSSTTFDSDSGNYGAAAALLRAVVTFHSGFQMFGQLGYAAFNFKTRFNRSDVLGDLENEVKVSGLTYGLGVGWRF